jgi:hypothetical protein
MPTRKQEMQAALAGKPAERLPWAPRLDLWYRANRRANTLPAKYRDASLIEIVDDLVWGYHAILPDFQDVRSPADSADRALGIYNLHMMPFHTRFNGVERSIKQDGDLTTVEYHTPRGSLRTVTLHDESMRAAGITISHIAEHAIKSVEDYAAAGYLFEHASVEPNYAGYQAHANHIGERGLLAAFTSLAASPMHLMQRELMPFELFCFNAEDYPNENAELAEKIGVYWRKTLDVVAKCPAELVFLGANYDTYVTSPPFYNQHIKPWLREFGERLHRDGKYLLTHPDGENTGLLPLYLESNFDVADSICPKPMTRISLQETREVFAGRITIMGGLPSVALLPSSVPDFPAFLNDFFPQLGRGDHHILGISDTTPPDADFTRLIEAGKRANDFGPIRP